EVGAGHAVGAVLALGLALGAALVAAAGVADVGGTLGRLLLGERHRPQILGGGHRDLLRGERLADTAGAERSGGDVARADPPLAVVADELRDLLALALREDGERLADGLARAVLIEDRLRRRPKLRDRERAGLPPRLP